MHWHMLEKMNTQHPQFALRSPRDSPKSVGCCLNVLHTLDFKTFITRLSMCIFRGQFLPPMIIIVPTSARKILVGNSRVGFALCGWGSAQKFGEQPEARLMAMLFSRVRGCAALRCFCSTTLYGREGVDSSFFCVFPSF